MNFPMENEIFRAIYWVINTAGIGGIAIMLLAGGLVTVFLLTIRWVVLGAKADESEQYVYPTPTLLGHHEE